MARDRTCLRLAIMARAAAATVECYLGSASSLPKLREKKIEKAVEV